MYTKDGEGASDLDHKERKTRPSISQLNRLDTRSNKHWLLEVKRIGCCAWSTMNKATRMKKCPECNMGLCATPCLEVYHTKLHF
jgi:hypothetical protein